MIYIKYGYLYEHIAKPLVKFSSRKCFAIDSMKEKGKKFFKKSSLICEIKTSCS